MLFEPKLNVTQRNKHSHGGSKITWIENDRIVSENYKIAKTFNTHFESVTDSMNLNLFEWIGESVNRNDKIEQIIFKFSKYPSILKIKQKIKINRKFSCQSVSEYTVKNVVKTFPQIKQQPVKFLLTYWKTQSFALVTNKMYQ